MYSEVGFFMEQGGEVPLLEMFGTFSLSVGAAVSANFHISSSIFFLSIQFGKLLLFDLEYCQFPGQFLGLNRIGGSMFQVGMEFWARWAHRALWHASLWHMHEV